MKIIWIRICMGEVHVHVYVYVYGEVHGFIKVYVEMRVHVHVVVQPCAYVCGSVSFIQVHVWLLEM